MEMQVVISKKVFFLFLPKNISESASISPEQKIFTFYFYIYQSNNTFT